MSNWIPKVALVGLAVLTGTVANAEDQSAEETITIADVMKRAHKEPNLLKKVAMGDASADEKQELLALYQALAKNTPPKGDQDSWNEKTHLLILAAQAAIKGKDYASKNLQKASNCVSCHRHHKE